jgi:hypothetical protein
MVRFKNGDLAFSSHRTPHGKLGGLLCETAVLLSPPAQLSVGANRPQAKLLDAEHWFR